MAELTKTIDDVSDPASVNYRKHKTSEEIASLTLNTNARDALSTYLISNGATTLFGEFVIGNAAMCGKPCSIRSSYDVSSAMLMF